MSGAATAVQAALVAALRDGLGAQVTGVFDGAPAGAVPPYATIGGIVTSGWGAKGLDGREHRLAVNLWDAPARAARLQGLMTAAEAAVAGMAVALPGHRIVGLLFLRARVVRGDGLWTGMLEYRVRTVPA